MPTLSSFPPVPASLGRRRLLKLGGIGVAGLAVAPLLAACGSDDDSSSSSSSGGGAAGTTALSMQLSWVMDAEFAPLYFADDKGFFADNGVKVDMVAGGPDIGAIEGIVAGGSTDLGIATDITSVIAAAADGNDLVCVGTLYQANLNCLISPPDAPITSVADMVGKRIGGAQGVQTKYDAMFALAGLEPDYTFVPVGYGPDALINGDCDVQSAFITDEVLAYEAATGDKPTILTYTDAGLPAYTLPIFTTKEHLAENRDAVKGMLKAIRDGYDAFAADTAEAATLSVKYGAAAGLEVESEQAKADAYLPLATGPTTDANGYLYIDVDYVAGDIYTGMEAAGLKTVPVGDVIDMSLLDELNQEA